jgi:hypothetical protein
MQLEVIGDNIWIVDGTAIPFLGLRSGTRSTIIRLSDGRLWLHSPIAYSPELGAELDQLGEIAFLVAPNTYHHMFLKEWAEHYPSATLVGPPGLPEKRRDLCFDAMLGEGAERFWQTEIEQTVFTGSRAFDEFIFFHRDSRTAILTDLIINLRLDDQSVIGRLVARIEGVAFPTGCTSLLYRLGMRDRAAGASAIRKLLSWQPTQAVISHGEWFRTDATDELRRRFQWLPL